MFVKPQRTLFILHSHLNYPHDSFPQQSLPCLHIQQHLHYLPHYLPTILSITIAQFQTFHPINQPDTLHQFLLSVDGIFVLVFGQKLFKLLKVFPTFCQVDFYEDEEESIGEREVFEEERMVLMEDVETVGKVFFAVVNYQLLVLDIILVN